MTNSGQWREIGGWVGFSDYNKNLEEVYKNYTYIPTKGGWKQNGKNREEKGEIYAQLGGIFKSFDGYNSMQQLKRHTQSFDLLHCTISHVDLLKWMKCIVISLFCFITCNSYIFSIISFLC